MAGSRLIDVHQRTTLALRPLATAVAKGTIHFATDTGVTTRSNGTIWESYSSAGGLVITRAITCVFDGIAAGKEVDVYVPYACTIKSATMLADVAGNAVIDIWKSLYAGFPPVVGGTITAAAKPTLAAANKSQDLVLTGWIVAIAADSTLRFHVDSAITVTRVSLTLTVEL